MKKSLKKILSILIAAIMLISIMPLSEIANFDWKSLISIKASATEKSDLPADFDLDEYSWQIIKEQQNSENRYDTQVDYNNLAYYMYFVFSAENDNGSVARIMYDCFANNKDYAVSAEAWEAVREVANPSNTLDDLNLQQQYESVLYALLFDSIGGSKIEEMSYSTAISDATGFMDYLLSASQTAEIIDKTDLDSTATKELKDAALAFISNGKESKWDTLADFNGMVDEIAGAIDKLYSTSTDILNYTQKVGMYCSLMDVGADTINVLLDMKKNTSNYILKAAIQSVVDTVSQDWYGVVEKVVLDSGTYVTSKALKELVDYAYQGCCAICPFLQGMAIGEKVGTAVCNLMFATEDNLKQYETLKIIVQIEDALTSTFNSYIKNVSSVGASAVWKSIDLGAVLYETGKDAAVEMAYICETKGLINIISNALGGNGKNTVTQYEQSANRINNGVQNNYNELRGCWKKYIAIDYPQFSTELKNAETGAIPITSINISEKQIYYRIGDYPALPQITINPSNATGGVGFKSDNEEIFGSDEYIAVSQFEKCQKAGTANITVYSIDDPTINDTFTLTVVGEDEATPETGIIDSGICGDDLTYRLTDSGRLLINGTGTMNFVNAPWYDNESKIKTVVILEGVTSIGEYAFDNCANLTSVTIPASVTHIGYRAFSKCPLNSIYYAGNIANWCSFDVGRWIEASNNGIPAFDNFQLYIDGKKIEGDLVIPDGVVSIGNDAFAWCKGITSVTISDSVTSIGGGAFQWCTNLTSITIPDSVTNIDDYAFGSCYSLTRINVGNNNQYFSNDEYGVLFNKDKTKLIQYPIGNKRIEYIIPDTVKRIGFASFCGCMELTSLAIPLSVTSVADWAFLFCAGLNDIYYAGGFEQWMEISIEDCNPNSNSLMKAEVHYYSTLCIHNLSHINHDASCTGNGTEYDQCTKCGAKLNVKNIPATGHNWGLWCVVDTPTIKNDGIEKRICSACGEEETRIISKLNGVYDDVTGIEVLFESESCSATELRVEKSQSGEALDLIKTVSKNSNVAVYDIATYNNGIKVQPSKKVSVRIPIPDGLNPDMIAVYYIDTENDSLTKIPNKVEYGYVVFETDHLNYYAVVEVKDAVPDEPVEQSYKITWNIDGQITEQKYKTGDVITAPANPTKDGYRFIGWTPEVPNIMPAYDLTFTAVFEKIETPIENEIKISIKNPSTTTINYGDAIVLHADVDGTLPEGTRIEWTASNGNFDMSVSADGLTCKISPKSNGKTVFTATVYDKDGNVIGTDTQEMTAKAGFFDKIVAFFKKIFGLTKTFPEAFKGIF